MVNFKRESLPFYFYETLRERSLVNYQLLLRKMGYRDIGGNTWVKPGYTAIVWPKQKYRRA